MTDLVDEDVKIISPLKNGGLLITAKTFIKGVGWAYTTHEWDKDHNLLGEQDHGQSQINAVYWHYETLALEDVLIESIR